MSDPASALTNTTLPLLVAHHSETYLNDLGTGDDQYTHTWWDAPDLGRTTCAHCGPTTTDLQAARRPDGTFDVTVIYGCRYGTDHTGVNLNTATSALAEWRHLAPDWVDATINAMKETTTCS